MVTLHNPKEFPRTDFSGIIDSIRTLQLTFEEVYLVFYSDIFYCCYAQGSKDKLTCVQYYNPKNNFWNLGDAQRFVLEINRSIGLRAKIFVLSKEFVHRIPDFEGNKFAANLASAVKPSVLSVWRVFIPQENLVPEEQPVVEEGSDRESWEVFYDKIYHQSGGLQYFREQLNQFLNKHPDISVTVFRKRAKIKSDATLDNFLKNEADTHRGNIVKIRGTFLLYIQETRWDGEEE